MLCSGGACKFSYNLISFWNFSKDNALYSQLYHIFQHRKNGCLFQVCSLFPSLQFHFWITRYELPVPAIVSSEEEAMLWFLIGLIASMTGLSLVWEHGGI